MTISTRVLRTQQQRRRSSLLLTSSIALLLLPLVLLPSVQCFVPSTARKAIHTTRRSTHRSSSAPSSERRRTSTVVQATTATSSATTLLPVADYSDSSITTQQSQSQHAPALFLHGLLGSKRNFASLATSLASQLKLPRQVLAADLRHHGEYDSSSDDDDDSKIMDYPTMAADVIALLDALDIQQIVLIGHSMGGKVAQSVALLYPDRVAGLVVLDMAPVAYDTTSVPWRTVHDIVHHLAYSVDLESCETKRDVDVQLRQAVTDPAIRAFCLTNLDPKSLEWSIPMTTIAANLDTLAGFNLGSSTGDDEQLVYPGDTFFIHGGQSKFVKASHMDAISTYFPSHLLTTIRGAGHWLHAEAPDDVIALLQRYLDRE